MRGAGGGRRPTKLNINNPYQLDHAADLSASQRDQIRINKLTVQPNDLAIFYTALERRLEVLPVARSNKRNPCPGSNRFRGARGGERRGTYDQVCLACAVEGGEERGGCWCWFWE